MPPRRNWPARPYRARALGTYCGAALLAVQGRPGRSVVHQFRVGSAGPRVTVPADGAA